MLPITQLTRIEPIHLQRLARQGHFTTGAVLDVDRDTFRAAPARAAGRPQVVPPKDRVIETWWEQARTLRDG